MTVDEIFASTFAQLGSASEQSAVERMDGYMDLIAGVRPEIERARSKFHLRRHTTATINTTQAKAISFAICMRGVTCGSLRIAPDGLAEFSTQGVNPAFASIDASLAKWTHWTHPSVRAYLDACMPVAHAKFLNREQGVQANFLDLMLGRTVTKKLQLRDFQPVALGGVPIQLPTPVRPRGSADSKSPGHLDVLARHGRGALAVFELKRPERKVGCGALRQAVTYAASLQWLMKRDEARARYWKAFGSRRSTHEPRFHAYAVVMEEDAEDLLAEWNELEAHNNHKLTLGVLLYSRAGQQLTLKALRRDGVRSKGG